MIAEGKPLELHGDRLAGGQHRLNVRAVRVTLARKLEDRHDALRGDRALDRGGGELDERRERGGEIARQLHEQHHRAVVDRAEIEPVSAPAEAEVADDQAAGREQRRIEHGEAVEIHRGVIIQLLHPVQPLEKGADEVEGLDALRVLQRLLVEGDHLAVDVAHLAAVMPHFPHEGLGDQQRQRRGDEREQRHGRVVAEDDDERGDELRKLEDQRGNPAEHACGDGRDVGIDARAGRRSGIPGAIAIRCSGTRRIPRRAARWRCDS